MAWRPTARLWAALAAATLALPLTGCSRYITATVVNDCPYPVWVGLTVTWDRGAASEGGGPVLPRHGREFHLYKFESALFEVRGPHGVARRVSIPKDHLMRAYYRHNPTVLRATVEPTRITVSDISDRQVSTDTLLVIPVLALLVLAGLVWWVRRWRRPSAPPAGAVKT